MTFRGQASSYSPDGLANLAEKAGVAVGFAEVTIDGMPYKEKAKYAPGVRALEAVLGAMGQNFGGAADEAAPPKLATA